MKKIMIVLFTVLLLHNIAFAQDEITNTPTDVGQNSFDTSLQVYIATNKIYHTPSGFGMTGWFTFPFINFDATAIYGGIGPSLTKQDEWFFDLTVGHGFQGGGHGMLYDIHAVIFPMYLEKKLHLPLFGYVNLEWADPFGKFHSGYTYTQLNYCIGFICPGIVSENFLLQGEDSLSVGLQIMFFVGNGISATFDHLWANGPVLAPVENTHKRFRFFVNLANW